MSSTSGLMELSELYRSRAELYDHFANAEDAPAKVLSFLATLVCNKTVLDCGCGTGKYVRLLAPFCKTYYAVDVAGDALERAASKAASNVQVISARAEALPLADHSVDVVFGTWVLGTISDTARRKLAIESCLRVLRPGGAMYLVENDIGGEFEYVRGRYPEIALTREYN